MQMDTLNQIFKVQFDIKQRICSINIYETATWMEVLCSVWCLKGVNVALIPTFSEFTILVGKLDK